MLDRFYKITTSIAASIAIAAFVIGGVVWAVGLDADVRGLQSDVSDLQTDVHQLQTDVHQLQTDVAEIRKDIAEIKETQRLILLNLQTLQTAILEHTHDDEGRAQIPPPSRG